MNDNRRPLKIRSNTILNRLAKNLAQKSIAPNHISLLSMFFAAIAALCFVLWAKVDNPILQATLIIVAVLGILGRLLCNLFDGMVAIEGGKKTASGELFNDIPDRVSDTLIFVAVGIGIGFMPYAFSLGISASLFAALTAYIRTLGTSMGAPALFLGPMAKQHRMNALIVGCVATIFEIIFIKQVGYSLYVTLILINIGSILTCINRTVKIHHYFNKP